MSRDLRPANIVRALGAFLEGESVTGLLSGSELAAAAASCDGADVRLSSVPADEAALSRESRRFSSGAADCTCGTVQRSQSVQLLVEDTPKLHSIS